jgi:nicotinate-nucleotide pyrophosphorylase (carboxylating)
LSAVPALDPVTVERCITSALEEDLGGEGDLTTRALFPSPRPARARIVARSRAVVAGVPVAVAVFRRLDPEVEVRAGVDDGAEVEAGTEIVAVRGDVRALLEGERTALNFLGRLSGIASAARRAVREVEGTGVTILDTRKTAPGLRRLDKYAVAVGGASNHRMGLFDAAMIKDTHLAAAGSIAAAVAALVERGVSPGRITVEVRSVEELREAIRSGAGRALLDNMDLVTLRACAAEGRGRIVLEASGGLRPGSLRAVAETGVDCLSLGWLTHSAPAADVAMEVVPAE